MAKTKVTVESFTRKRAVVIAASAMAMIVAAVLAWMLITRLSSKAVDVNLMPIREVHFSAVEGTLTRVDAAQLRHIAGAVRSLGGSMFSTDLEEVRKAVQQVPWVRDVRVSRRFPDRLEISIEEHQPFARWVDVAMTDAQIDPTTGQVASTLVNTFGEVFIVDFDAALPLFVGPHGSAANLLARWKSLSASLAQSANPILRPAELRLSPRRAWQLRLDNGATLELGRQEPEHQLRRALDVAGELPAVFAANARVDMRYPNGLALRVAAVGSPKASRSRN